MAARRRSEEEQIHRAVVQHLRRRAVSGVVWFHVPNDGKRSIGAATRLQTMGMRKGVSDLIIIHDGRAFALELKAPNVRPTVEQMQFASDFNAAGGHACICHDLDRALRVLECWQILRGSDHSSAVLDAGADDVTCAPGGPNKAQIPVRKVRGMRRRRAA